MYDIILKKRNGYELAKEEIEFFVYGYTNGQIPDYQVSALMMAIYFNKMSIAETSYLTMAMVNSGHKIDLSSINGIKVDKHSTGGVGDKTSLVLAPMVAAVGVPVAKMSGRGLGHTGGTIDKLESFPDFSVNLDNQKFINNVNDYKIAIVGQSTDLAPADKKLYALRDVTATVDNISLIASSIMSKKIAAGADAIVLDVKYGKGAFMKTLEEANILANTMVNIGKSVGKNTSAIISDMNQPLGFAVGNILEVIEAINTLKGNGPKDLLELCLNIGSHMVVMAQKSDSLDEARKMLEKAINDGSALKKFKQFIEAQGGDSSYIDNIEKFDKAEFIYEVKADKAGYVEAIECQSIGTIVMGLGGGRENKEQNIDLTVGIVLNKKIGNNIKIGDTIAVIYANDKTKLEKAEKELINCYKISDEEVNEQPLIKNIII
jgi:pyrimidine-nucleoside phosphorylase